MGIINVLDIHVANLIAAGEVVDRPASAVKELVENSIDAGATKVTVEIKKGGIAFIRVCDNGKGMSKEDVPVCIQRHATSKIKNQWDLARILTLGFRGEALAAISSVSKVRIMTKRREDRMGTLMVCEPGDEVVMAETGCPDGTTIIVEELFANVPARRKFLKKDMTEGMAVSAIVEKLALSRPDISFKFISDDTLKFSTSGDGKLSNAIYAVYGREFVKKMTEVEWLSEGVKIYGYVGNPDNVKNNRNHQIIFVNDRFIRNKTISAALEQAYDSYIPEGKFPCCVLKIDLHPAYVDANVHPTKAEVKFSDEKMIFESVYSTARGALENKVLRPTILENDETPFEKIETEKMQEGRKIINSFVPVEEKSERTKPENLTFNSDISYDVLGVDLGNVSGEKSGIVSEEPATNKNTVLDNPLFGGEEPEVSVPKVEIFNTDFQQKDKEKQNIVTPVQEVENSFTEQNVIFTPDSELGESYEGRQESPTGKYVYDGATYEPKEEGVPFYRVLGEAFYAYIFVELKDRVLIIDKHAAHERMIFEELKSNMKKKKNVLQFLLVPEKVTLDSNEKAVAMEYCDDISAIGFEMRWEENGDLMLYAVPVGLGLEGAVDLFMTVCSRLGQGMGSAQLSRDIVFEKALYQASCKAAIKAGRPDDIKDTEAFVKKLMALPDIKYCPHGRPVAFEMTKDGIEKQFKRK